MLEFESKFHSLLSLLLHRWLLFMEKWELCFICPSQRRKARVALYVNGALFVNVLHMLITPCFNLSRVLSGTVPVACVQGLAARVAVTGFNQQQTCSPATRCFECICIETTTGVLHILTMRMHSFITSNNKWQFFDGCFFFFFFFVVVNAVNQLLFENLSFSQLHVFRCLLDCWEWDIKQ